MESFKKFAISVDLPWILLGGFNDMLDETDKMGGLPLNRNRIATFRECVDQYGLLDLGFLEPRFTWTNKNPIWHRNIKCPFGFSVFR